MTAALIGGLIIGFCLGVIAAIGALAWACRKVLIP